MGEKNRSIQYDELALNLYKNTMTGEWKKVVETYEQHQLSAIDARINKSGDTAFHVAVSIAPEEKVQQLVRVITGVSELGLWTKNNKGNNPLHVAASTGRLNICILLAKAPQDLDIEDLVIKDLFRNNVGESPLFLAAFHGYKPIFLYLHLLLLKASDTDIKSIDPAYRRNDGETALHCAIRWEYFDVAYEMLLKEPSLAYAVNEIGITPLHLLASKPSVFKSGSHLGWWKSIIYHCIYVEDLMPETTRQELIDSVINKEIDKSSETADNNFRKNYQTCIHFYQVLWSKAHSDIMRAVLPFSIFCTLFIRVILGLGYEAIRSRKRKHVYSVQIMKILMESTSNEAKSDFTSGTNPHQTINQQDWIPEGPPPPPFLDNTTEHVNKINETAFTLEVIIKKGTALEEKKDGTGKGETTEMKKTEAPILVATRNGITNMVEQILQKLPMAINGKSKEKTETTILLAARNGITEIVEYILNKFPLAIDDKSEGQNIVLLAAKNRQTHVLQLLLEQEFVKRKLIHEVDSDENNALHLAAQIGKQRPWLIPGAALQMQWEIKWYEFVKDNMPQHFCYQVNKEGKTPEEIFIETHEDLVKQGGEWLNKTSESFSIVAALIATVAFASSTTIPGNLNEENGKPNLESHSMLTIFAISSLIALCFSIIALFSFLAILTSRYEQKDFHRDMPKKLLFGLTALLISITSMLVSFCAGHYFMLKNKLKDKAFPVYAATCLPIVFFAIQQLPLYIDIVWAIYKKVPRSSFKAVSL
ncbi:hypothetical protein CMV_016374 [Castanea mollissima]|uniref:PGG domain-containing protein n=1 Tax=Castanea mollissima TaxID=60419 RepID=A0A8J4VRV1_9ROSI|nr:hypothetical protein CMV_016374 [Castanea mollissima]